MARFEAALSSSTFTLETVASGPERRLLGHLDALVLAGATLLDDRLAALLAASKPPPVPLAMVAVVAFLVAERTELATRALSNDAPSVRHAAFRACSLAGGSSLDPWIGQNLANPSSAVARSVLLDLAADRGIVVDALAGSLRSSDPAELVAALRMAWRAPPAEHETRLVELMRHPDRGVRDAAMVTSLHHGSAHGWALCQDLAFDPAAPHPFAMALVAGLGDPGQHRRLAALAGSDAHRPGVLRALGYAGNAGVVPLLIQQAESKDELTAAAAADALGVIAGPEADVAGAAGKEEPGSLRRWWQNAHARFDERSRCLAGVPLTRAAFALALTRFPTRRRYLLSLLLSIRTGGAARVSTWAFSERQRAQIGALASRGPEEPWAREFSFY